MRIIPRIDDDHRGQRPLARHDEAATAASHASGESLQQRLQRRRRGAENQRDFLHPSLFAGDRASVPRRCLLLERRLVLFIDDDRAPGADRGSEDRAAPRRSPAPHRRRSASPRVPLGIAQVTVQHRHFSANGPAGPATWRITRDQLIPHPAGSPRTPYSAPGAAATRARAPRTLPTIDGPKAPSPDNPIQLVDIAVSQHWIRSLAWKLSILLGICGARHRPPLRRHVGGLSRSRSPPTPSVASKCFPCRPSRCTARAWRSRCARSPPCLPTRSSAAPAEDALAIKYSKGAGAKAVLKCLADRIFRTQTMNPGLRDALAAKLEVALEMHRYCSRLIDNVVPGA